MKDLIPLFCPSKNRSCQLDLFLRSINKNSPIFFPHILFKQTSEEFSQGYTKLIDKQILPMSWQIEKDIEVDFLNFLHKNDIFCIATDDTIIYRPLRASPTYIRKLLEDEEVFCVSLRMGLNCLIQNYRTGEPQYPITNYECINREYILGIERKEQFIKWFWKQYPVHSNASYFCGQDMVVYRSKDWLDLIDFKFSNLRHVESEMIKKGGNVMREYMVSPYNSVAVNIPANNSQEPFIENGFNSFSTEELNEKYLNGEIIDLEKIEKVDVKGCHQAINYEFTKEKHV